MKGGLRHRRYIHAGLPSGSTMDFGSAMQICYLLNEGVDTVTASWTNESAGTETVEDLVTVWADQSANGNDATNDGAGSVTCPRQNTDGSIEFYNHGDNATYADHMNFTKFTVSTSHPFMCFIVCTLGNATTSCYLSDTGSEVLQYSTSSTHQLKTGTTSNMDHSGVFTNSTGAKHLMVVERTGGDKIKLYKNGLSGGLDVDNDGDFDLVTLGAKNIASGSNWFDGAIYDVIFVDNEQSDYKRERITDYLLKKNGIRRLGNG